MKLFTPHFGVLDNPGAHLEKNVTTLLEWRHRLEQLVSRQISVDGIIANILEDVARQVGRRSSDVPDLLKGTIRVSVLGFLSYLEWRSRQ
jgi:hypothetical protein